MDASPPVVAGGRLRARICSHNSGLVRPRPHSTITFISSGAGACNSSTTGSIHAPGLLARMMRRATGIAQPRQTTLMTMAVVSFPFSAGSIANAATKRRHETPPRNAATKRRHETPPPRNAATKRRHETPPRKDPSQQRREAEAYVQFRPAGACRPPPPYSHSRRYCRILFRLPQVERAAGLFRLGAPAGIVPHTHRACPVLDTGTSPVNCGRLSRGRCVSITCFIW